MGKLWTCRRTFISLVAIMVLTGIGLYLGDSSVGAHITVVASAVCAANAYQKKGSDE